MVVALQDATPSAVASPRQRTHPLTSPADSVWALTPLPPGATAPEPQLAPHSAFQTVWPDGTPVLPRRTPQASTPPPDAGELPRRERSTERAVDVDDLPRRLPGRLLDEAADGLGIAGEPLSPTWRLL